MICFIMAYLGCVRCPRARNPVHTAINAAQHRDLYIPGHKPQRQSNSAAGKAKWRYLHDPVRYRHGFHSCPPRQAFRSLRIDSIVGTAFHFSVISRGDRPELQRSRCVLTWETPPCAASETPLVVATLMASLHFVQPLRRARPPRARRT